MLLFSSDLDMSSGIDSAQARKHSNYRPKSSKSGSSSGRPTTSEYDRALQQDIMEENVDVETGRFTAPQVNKSLTMAVTGGVVLFCLIFGIVIIVDSVHTIEEGNVGIYFVQGALDDS